MRTVKLTFASLFILLVSATAWAKDYKVGEDYFELDNKVSKTQQITEYFSFYCPACFRQEPFMKTLKATLPTANAFSKNHVTNMPGRDEATETLLSQALITAKLLDVEQPVVDAIFQQIHVSRSNMASIADIKALFTKQGIDGKKFDKTFNSFKVKVEAKRMAANTQKLRDKGYGSVPTLVINNNYVPNIRSIKTLDEYKALIRYLLTLNK